MAAAYQQSSLLAFVSTYEGFGLPILEAQACGIPVVTSDIPPMCDVAGGAGILVNPQDKASIRRGVELAIGDTNLRLTLSKTGLLNAAQYTPTRIAGQYADTYRRILNRRLSGSGKRI
jgi:glycosyltransferase involved in cell wall biosynthesis